MNQQGQVSYLPIGHWAGASDMYQHGLRQVRPGPALPGPFPGLSRPCPALPGPALPGPTQPYARYGSIV